MSSDRNILTILKNTCGSTFKHSQYFLFCDMFGIFIFSINIFFFCIPHPRVLFFCPVSSIFVLT